MNDLRREQAPITGDAWQAIDGEVRLALKQLLAARRVVDFRGPLGWSVSAVPTGRVDALTPAPGDGVAASQRIVRALVELHAPFELAFRELEVVARGGSNPDLTPAVTAARAIAIAEDRAVFHGYAAGEIVGICEAAADHTLAITENYELYPGVVARALGWLRTAGVGGPYAIALGPKCYTGLTQTTDNGFPVIAHVQRLIDGPLIWAPGLDGASVLSLRGGDFALTVGRDFSIGYTEHNERAVSLYIEESLTFEVITPEAAVPLAYEQPGRSKRAARVRLAT
jgi:uncharacterized linocin/CFP29 family protein